MENEELEIGQRIQNRNGSLGTIISLDMEEGEEDFTVGVDWDEKNERAIYGKYSMYSYMKISEIFPDEEKIV